MNITEAFPRNFNIEKKFKDKYNELEREGIFEESSHLEVFLNAMAIGWYHGIREPLDKSYPLVNTDSIDKDKAWLVASISVAEEDISVLNDFTRVRKIADEYANGGFPILLDRLKSGMNRKNIKELLRDMHSIIEEL